MKLSFSVPAIPIAQPRQRHRVLQVAGRTISQNYTPTKAPVNDFKATVRMAFKEAWSGPPISCGPVRLDCIFVFPRMRELMWKTKPMVRIPHCKRPDRDNLDKAVLDALKGLLFSDDAQVYCGTIEKWIASGDEQPHVEIRVEA